MVMEDSEAPHHLLLLRNFMSQGVLHRQPLLYASPAHSPRAFLGTLPAPIPPRTHLHTPSQQQEEDLRIAWQYKKYFGNEQMFVESHRGNHWDFCNEFDLRKSLDRQLLGAAHIDCVNLQDVEDLASLRDRCSAFLAPFARTEEGITCVGRVAIQSFCSPQCRYSNSDWDMLFFIKSLRSMLRSSNAVAMITFTPSVVSSSSVCMRWQHLADTLLSLRTIPDDDKEMAKLLTDYQDMFGLLHIHKVGRLNSQVPVILEATTYSLKVIRRKTLVLERLNQAPVDASGGGSLGGCSGSSSARLLDF
ncbi:hypothetical protein AMTR_s00086p00125290 [Amborella trichopoda]|uniref:Elongator complex protein 4 n=2 Tax=Amborella trichopoda TaxID=13333 RepID=W1NYY5_AMBTC|nr:hypothetical protein AMTR_s00086p00125290 [Amborella trichopoda]